MVAPRDERRATHDFSCIHPRREQIFDTDAAEHFRADTVGDAVDNFGAVLRRIDVRAERPLAEGHADHADDRFGDGPCIGVGGLKRGETLQRLIRQARIRPLIILRARALSAGEPEWAKWLVPLVKAPGTMIEVSMPQRASSPA